MKKDNFKKLDYIFKKTAKLVDPKIKKVLGIYIDKENRKLVNYQIEVGGKRLRPTLAILSCLVCGGKTKDVLYPAAGIEILHNYSLIVDDIIDNSNLRRGKATTWFKFGESIAHCIGINYAGTVFQTANRSKNPVKISELFAKSLKKIVEGEILDILFEQSGRNNEDYVVKNRYKNITLKDYIRMISKKTAFLFQASCEVGGLSANANNKKLAALRNYSFNLGIAFQIKDDLLDIFGNPKKFRKKIGTDIKEKKLGNLVIFYALSELSQIKKSEILSILRKNKINDKNIKKVISIIKTTKAEIKAGSLAQKYIKKAKKSLKLLPQNEWNKNLSAFADFVNKRVL